MWLQRAVSAATTRPRRRPPLHCATPGPSWLQCVFTHTCAPPLCAAVVFGQVLQGAGVVTEVEDTDTSEGDKVRGKVARIVGMHGLHAFITSADVRFTCIYYIFTSVDVRLTCIVSAVYACMWLCVCVVTEIEDTDT